MIDTTTETSAKTRTTGPLQKVKSWFAPAQTGSTIASAPSGTVYDRLMAEVESFSEDHLTLDEKVHTVAARIAAVIVPFVAVYAIGDIVGGFMTPAFGAGPAHVLSYCGELLKSFLILTFARALSRRADGPGYFARLGVTFAIWLTLQVGTVFVLYIIALPTSGNTTLTLARVCGFGLLDVASMAILFWKGKSTAQHQQHVSTKIAAFKMVHSAQQEQERVMQQAALQDQQHKITMEAQQKFSNAIVGLMDEFLSQLNERGNGNGNRTSRW
jgi:hypothetical protein